MEAGRVRHGAETETGQREGQPVLLRSRRNSNLGGFHTIAGGRKSIAQSLVRVDHIRHEHHAKPGRVFALA